MQGIMIHTGERLYSTRGELLGAMQQNYIPKQTKVHLLIFKYILRIFTAKFLFFHSDSAFI
jgi:hypothetical protein